MSQIFSNPRNTKSYKLKGSCPLVLPATLVVSTVSTVTRPSAPRTSTRLAKERVLLVVVGSKQVTVALPSHRGVPPKLQPRCSTSDPHLSPFSLPLKKVASDLRAKASTLVAMASTLVAMASLLQSWDDPSVALIHWMILPVLPFVNLWDDLFSLSLSLSAIFDEGDGPHKQKCKGDAHRTWGSAGLSRATPGLA